MADSDRVSRVPPYLGNKSNEIYNFQIRDYHPLWFELSWTDSFNYIFFDSSRKLQFSPTYSHYPILARFADMTLKWFRLFPVRSPLLWKSLLFSIPEGTEMFHFPSLPPSNLYIQLEVSRHYSRKVVPFGNLRIKNCLHLPEAYRSLPRPSSSLHAKASTVCS